MAVKLLEPLFEPHRKVDQQHGHALYVLCDALDMLGHVNKKIKLLKRIASANSELSADAGSALSPS